MDYLLFPVKRAAEKGLIVLGSLVLVAPFACGYRSEQALSAATPLCVRAAPPKLPDLGAVQAALDGARDELAQRGALGSSYPCLVLELLRVDEAPTGLSAPLAGDLQPFARGTSVRVVGRGWVEATRGAPTSRDTGDVSRVARTAATQSGAADSTHHDAQVRAAAERTGRAIVAIALGLPEPQNELP
ncbi:MAG: hypothetical protein QM756_26975 [Polyangiaceae bacterium]